MQTAPKDSGALPAWLFKFLFCFIGGAVYTAAVVYLSGIVPEEQINLWLIGAGALLWAACAWMGWRRAPMTELVGAIIGLMWGGLAAALMTFRLMEMPLKVNVPGLLLGFVAAPLVVLITVLPFWLMGKKSVSPPR